MQIARIENIKKPLESAKIGEKALDIGKTKALDTRENEFIQTMKSAAHVNYMMEKLKESKVLAAYSKCAENKIQYVNTQAYKDMMGKLQSEPLKCTKNMQKYNSNCATY